MDLTPPDLGARIMAAAQSRRAPGYSVESGPAAAGGAQVYEESTDIVGATFADLADVDWGRTVPPYRWTVHDLLAHLLAVERYTAGQLGVPGLGEAPEPEDDDHLTFADPTIAAERLRAPAETLADWWEVVGRVRGAAADPDRPVAFHGMPMRADDLLVLRGFELWIHAEDVSGAVHGPPAIPSPPALRSMAELAVATVMPRVLPVVRRAAAGEVRVVLTGAGGGTWRLDLGDGDTSALLVADVVDYCRYAARRGDRDGLAVHVEGDAALAEDVLAASRHLAV